MGPYVPGREGGQAPGLHRGCRDAAPRRHHDDLLADRHQVAGLQPLDHRLLQ